MSNHGYVIRHSYLGPKKYNIILTNPMLPTWLLVVLQAEKFDPKLLAHILNRPDSEG